jgi:hypothetical protein
MFYKKQQKIEIGDRFVKSDEPKTVWVITGLGSSVVDIPHFQVSREGYESRIRTLSEKVLQDPSYYMRVE